MVWLGIAFLGWCSSLVLSTSLMRVAARAELVHELVLPRAGGSPSEALTRR